MADIAQLGIMVDSRPAVKAEGDLDRLALAAGRAEMAAQDLAGAHSRTLAPALGNVNKGFSLAGNGARMMSQQLSQVGQQTMASGNFIQALAIQLPDIGLAFGAVGSAVGLLAGIGLPLLMSALGGTSSSAKEMEEALQASGDAAKDVEEVLSSIEAYNFDNTLSGMAELSGVVLRDFENILSVINEMQGVALESALSKMRDQIGLAEQIKSYMYDASIAAQLGGEDKWSEFLGLKSLNEARFALISINEIEGKTREEILKSVDATAEKLRLRGLLTQPIKEQLALMAQELGLEEVVTEETKRQSNELERAATTLRTMPGFAESLVDGLFEAAEGASAMAGNLAVAAKNAWDAVGAFGSFQSAQQQLAAGGKVYSGRGGDPATSNQKGVGAFTFTPQSSAGGGGGGSVDPFEAQLEALQTSLMTERQVTEEWYAEGQALLADRRAQEMLGEQGHNEALLALKQEYYSRLGDADSDYSNTALGAAEGFFGAMATVTRAGGEKTVKATRTFSAAQAVINSYRAFTEVLADPSFIGRPFARFAAAAGALSSGLAAVAAIRSGGGGSPAAIGGGGGGYSAPAAQSTAPASPAQKPIEYTIRGIDRDALLTGAQWEKIYDGLFIEAKKRGAQGATVRFL